jgi:cytochrome c-type biogenesis protein CcmH/NrfG
MTKAGSAAALLMAFGLSSFAWANGGDMGTAPSMPEISAPKVTVEQIDAAYADGIKAVEASDWKAAVAKFKFVTRNAAKNADGWNYLGYASRKGGDAKAGEAAYKRALRIDPNHPRANEYYGELLLQLNRVPEAEERLAVLNKCCASDAATAKLASLIADAKAGKPTDRNKPVLTY